MHKIFGTKENVEYTDRVGVYLIPIRNNQVGVILAPKGYFFLGGGIENGEDHIACLHREAREESGYTPVIKVKVCSAETYCVHPPIGYFHPIQTYYLGDLAEKVSTPDEKDIRFVWVELDQIRGKMCIEMQNWALEQALTALQ